jgi:lysyl-tRNA synthetase, class II
VPTEQEILAARRERADRLKERGENLFPARVPRDLVRLPELLQQHGETPGEQLEAQAPTACVAGRIMSLRSFGKAAFAVIQSEGARIQLWFKKDAVGEDRYEIFRDLQTGDFVFGRGLLLRTKSNELTVEVREFGLLSKAYRPIPDDWYGLADVEARYRQRYLDLLVNADARRIAVLRSRIVSALRAGLDERGFLEVETPILQPIYGGAHALPFVTHHNTYDQQLYLRISFELYLKRLVIGGIDRVYELGRDFRNEGVSRKHNPEFSMLEVYQAYADYEDMMELVEQLVSEVARKVLGTTKLELEGQTVDVAPPWPRRSMASLILEATGVDIDRERTLEALRTCVREKRVARVDPAEAPSWARLVDAIFSEHVEPQLIHPTFVVDYPLELSPLAKRSEGHAEQVERFEAFVGGMELANAFSELNDPDDQRQRFEAQSEARASGDLEAQPADEDFLRALEYGMPPTGGVGMGVGRLVMLLTGCSNLREVKLFPHLRPRDD